VSLKFNAKELVEILKVCGEAQVSHLKLGDLDVKFHGFDIHPKEEVITLPIETEEEESPKQSKYDYADDLVLTDPDAWAMGQLSGVTQ
jgi:hypothetical protein